MELIFDLLCHADFSGRLRKSKATPGLSAFSATVESIRDLNPAGTLLLDAGDHFSVNLWGGLPVVKAANLMGTDVMTLGNHEFDRGSAFLEECIAACEFPVLCANIHYKDGTPIQGTLPYVILERQGVKFGVLGIGTEYTPLHGGKIRLCAFCRIQRRGSCSALYPRDEGPGSRGGDRPDALPFLY